LQAQIAMKLQQQQLQLQLPVPIAADEHREQNGDNRWDIIELYVRLAKRYKKAATTLR